MIPIKALLFKSFTYLKYLFFKTYASLIIFADKGSTWSERLQGFWNSFQVFAPIAFVASIFNAWYLTNQKFVLALVLFIFVNMALGGIMHFKKGNFNWELLLRKTVLMIVVVGITYFVLEIIISFGGDNVVTQGFKAVLQVSSLLYPGSKILKHVFVLSDGEHPPQHLMERIYNFKKNGDLQQFLSPKAVPENPQP